MQSKERMIRLFNLGILKLTDAESYHEQGFDFIISGGILIDIIQE